MVLSTDAPIDGFEKEIEASVEAAATVAADMPPPKRGRPPGSKGRGPGKKKMKAWQDLSELAKTPIAQALDSVCDGLTGIPGLSAQSKFGAAWVGVLEYYFSDAIDHPLAVAVFATGQVAVVAVGSKMIARRLSVEGQGPPA